MLAAKHGHLLEYRRRRLRPHLTSWLLVSAREVDLREQQLQADLRKLRDRRGEARRPDPGTERESTCRARARPETRSSRASEQPFSSRNASKAKEQAES